MTHGRFAGPPPLSLELLCGASDVDEEHPGWWEGIFATEGGVHPGQAAVRDALAAEGIHVDVEAHREDGVDYSDAYVRFHPAQLDIVARALRAADYPGDILDITGPVTAAERERIEAVADEEGWSVEDEDA